MRHNHSLAEKYQKCTMRVQANVYNIKQSNSFHVSHLSHINGPPNTMHAVTHILKHMGSVQCEVKQMCRTSNNQTLFMSAIFHTPICLHTPCMPTQSLTVWNISKVYHAGSSKCVYHQTIKQVSCQPSFAH